MKIGELARSCGVGLQTIRYYERQGLLADPRSRRVGYRDYDGADLARLRFIRASSSSSRVSGALAWWELISQERGCCSTLAFELRFEPEAGPVLLRCLGPLEATFIERQLVGVAGRRE